MKYTAPQSFENFNLYQCGKQGDAGKFLARDPMTTEINISFPVGDTTTSAAEAVTTVVYVIGAATIINGTIAGNPASTPNNTINPSPGDNGLSPSDKIALICGIAIGLPATIAGIVTCIIALKKGK
ncbi:hypothetical protein PG996_004678 [Apiospora saccharicola]|uniref:Uncharacterized protein n=1 Tax=Apiospora saccharicola TaxID=335842 RepID=A0ABR1W4S3_9PEZI